MLAWDDSYVLSIVSKTISVALVLLGVELFRERNRNKSRCVIINKLNFAAVNISKLLLRLCMT